MSAITFFAVIIVACITLSALMLGLIFVSETKRDFNPFFQAVLALVLVFLSIIGLRHAKWAMDHHVVIHPAYWYQFRAWMHPIQAIMAFGGGGLLAFVWLVDAVRRFRRS